MGNKLKWLPKDGGGYIFEVYPLSTRTFAKKGGRPIFGDYGIHTPSAKLEVCILKPR